MPETMRTLLLKLDEIKSDESKSLIPEKLEALKESILEKGLITPIALDQDYHIISGAHRYQAFCELAKEHEGRFEDIPARIAGDKEYTALHLKTTENLFRPDLSILEKAESFKAYFDTLKYGEDKHKTLAIFKSLDISRRTFFNLRVIIEQLTEDAKVKIKSLSQTGLQNSTPQLLALSKYSADMQMKLLELMERESYQTIFEAIKSLDFSKVEQKLKKQKFLKSPNLKLSKDLREELRNLSKQTGKGQNELFNEIFEAGLEVIQAKYI